METIPDSTTVSEFTSVTFSQAWLTSARAQRLSVHHALRYARIRNHVYGRHLRRSRSTVSPNVERGSEAETVDCHVGGEDCTRKRGWNTAYRSGARPRCEGTGRPRGRS